MTTQMKHDLYASMQTLTRKARDDLYAAFKEKYALAMGVKNPRRIKNASSTELIITALNVAHLIGNR